MMYVSALLLLKEGCIALSTDGHFRPLSQAGKALLDSAGDTPEIKFAISYPKFMKPERLPSFLETLV